MRNLVILILAIGITGCGQNSKNSPTEIMFYKNLGEARTVAIKTKKPLVMDFYTDWCKYCKMLDSLTFTDSIVISMSKDNLFVKIDAEEDTIATRQYGIAGYPTIVVAHPDGAEIDRISGYLPPNEFYNQVQLYLQGKETLEDFLTRLADEPDNPEYLMLIGEKYCGRSNWPKAIEFYNRVFLLDQDNKRGLGARAMAAIYDVHGRSKDLQAALDIAAELIKRYPDSREAENALAMTGYYTAQSGDEKSAAAIYRSYLEKYPNGLCGWVQKRLADIEEKL